MTAVGPAVRGQAPAIRRPWPTPQDYNEAIQNPALNFTDPELRSGTPELTPLGLPRAITGGFASVYRLHCGGGTASGAKSWAVRCFLREVPDQQERYAAIGRHLARAKLPATVGFTFLADGIRVGGRSYPILKMAWVQGESLDRWIERHLGEPRALRAMADRWIALIGSLRRAGIAHGDLQHGNIMVVGDELRLIDYDGLYVPDLAGRASSEVGHRNYQHPRRAERDFGPHLDHFAAWSILLSLRALAVEPGLWARCGAGDEALLLRREDYDRPATSTTLAALAGIADPALQSLVGRFRGFLDLDLAQVPALDVAPPRRRASRGAVAVRAPVPVPAAGAAAWLADHLPAPPVPQLARSLAPERFALAGMVVLLAVLGVLALAGVLAAVTALLAAALCLLVALVTLVVRFLALPTTPDLALAWLRVLHARARIGWWSALGEAAGRWSERAAAREATRIAGLNEARRDLARAERAALEAARLPLERLDEERRRLPDDEAAELARALRAYQHRAIAARLAAFSLLDAELPAFGAQVSLQLLKAGVRTAGDFIDVRVVRQAGNEIAQLELPDGTFIRIDGLGRKRARALLAWRAALVAREGRALPAALPDRQVAAIQLRYHNRGRDLGRQIASATRRVGDQERVIQRQARDQRAVLSHRAATLRQRDASARARRDAFAARVASHLAAAQLAQTLARRTVASYCAVGPLAYLRAIIGLGR